MTLRTRKVSEMGINNCPCDTCEWDRLTIEIAKKKESK
jgi:hypothetical protein